MNNKKVSIIILTYKSELHIYECIDSVQKFNDIGNELEIIVVDNNSPDVDLMFSNIKDIYGDEIILVKNDKNGGYGQGNNVGIKVALSPIILIMNPDVRLVHPIFCEALNTFSNNNITMLGMEQYYNSSERAVSFFLATIYNSSIINRIINALLIKWNIFLPKKMCISGACFFIDKQKFSEIGLFDENIFMYGEESDIHYRIPTKNEIVFSKKMRYVHLAGGRGWNIKTIRSIFISKLYLAKKYNCSVKKVIRNEIIYTLIHIVLATIKKDKQIAEIFKNWLNEVRTVYL